MESLGDRRVQERFAGTAWLRCDSWYRNPSGRVVANWPGHMREYVRRTRTLDAGEHGLVPLPEREPAAV